MRQINENLSTIQLALVVKNLKKTAHHLGQNHKTIALNYSFFWYIKYSKRYDYLNMRLK
ncbi:hypothetical protein DSUL_80087 [Desulfovibrionales bacterium]